MTTQKSIAYIPLRARDGSVRAYAIVDATDYGWAAQYRWSLNNNEYAWRWKGQAGHCMMHRELIGARVGDIVDHLNRNKLDNRRANLRFTDRVGNATNRKVRVDNRTGYRGVHLPARSNSYIASIRYRGKSIYLGSYETAEDAALVRDHAARFYHGEFAALNLPDNEEEIPNSTLNNTLKLNNTSGYRGVTYRKKGGGYVARIGVNYAREILGVFDTPEEAARAYDDAARRHHGRAARLNFPDKE